MKDWKDISLKQFYHIKALLDEPDEYLTFNLLDLIYDIDSASLPLSEVSKYSTALEFLAKEPPTVNLKEQYTINGTVYNSNFNLTKVTAAQFIDYQNYIKDNKWEDFLSVFFIPKGHNYNDGYDIQKVKEDILTLDICTVKSISVFITLQLQRFLKRFRYYFKQDLKKMKLTGKSKEIIDKQLQLMDSINLV